MATAKAENAAVQNAVQNATGNLGAAPTPPIPAEVRRLAIQIIEKAYDAQIGVGGIDELTGKLAQKKENVGNLLREILDEAVRIGGNNLPVVKTVFNILCSDGEDVIKGRDFKKVQAAAKAAGEPSPSKERGITDIMPTWSVYKSGYNKSLDHGIHPDTPNPNDPTGEALLYSTASKYKDAWKAPTRGANERDTSKSETNQKKVTFLQAVMAEGYAPKLTGALGAFREVCATLTAPEQEVAAQRLDVLTKEMAEMHKATIASVRAESLAGTGNALDKAQAESVQETGDASANPPAPRGGRKSRSVSRSA